MKLLLIFLVSLSACGQSKSSDTDVNNTIDTTVTSANIKDTFAQGVVMKNIICKNSPQVSFALYIPGNSESQTLPVIYFFDPHADGQLPLNKYKSLADSFHFILVGSNNSKNGNDWQTAENIYTTLSADTKQRLNINENRIYVCGFSGGAKVASYIALNHPEVKGVIVTGAGLPDGKPVSNFNFSYTMLAGNGDMNMTDLAALNNQFDKTQTRHRIIFFDGKHEWPSETIMAKAFQGLQLDAMQEQLIPINEKFISSFSKQQQQIVNDNIAANKLLDADNVYNYSANMLQGLQGGEWFKTKQIAFTKTKSYQDQLTKQKTIFSAEEKQKEVFNQMFQQGDINYWAKTINSLNAASKQKSDEVAMNQRLLAYLSLAFYSISNNLINNNQNEQAKYFVDLYKLADPSNSEAWYFSAVTNARNNNAAETMANLEKAVQCGFNDKQRLINQPEFIAMASSLNLSKIESEIETKNQ